MGTADKVLKSSIALSFSFLISSAAWANPPAVDLYVGASESSTSHNNTSATGSSSSQSYKANTLPDTELTYKESRKIMNTAASRIVKSLGCAAEDNTDTLSSAIKVWGKEIQKLGTSPQQFTSKTPYASTLRFIVWDYLDNSSACGSTQRECYQKLHKPLDRLFTLFREHDLEDPNVAREVNNINEDLNRIVRSIHSEGKRIPPCLASQESNPKAEASETTTTPTAPKPTPPPTPKPAPTPAPVETSGDEVIVRIPKDRCKSGTFSFGGETCSVSARGITRYSDPGSSRYAQGTRDDGTKCWYLKAGPSGYPQSGQSGYTNGSTPATTFTSGAIRNYKSSPQKLHWGSNGVRIHGNTPGRNGFVIHSREGFSSNSQANAKSSAGCLLIPQPCLTKFRSHINDGAKKVKVRVIEI